MKKIAAALGVLAVGAVAYAFWPSGSDELSEGDMKFEGFDTPAGEAEPTGDRSGTERRHQENSERSRTGRSNGDQPTGEEGASKTAETEVQVLGVEEVDRDEGTSGTEPSNSASVDERAGAKPPEKSGASNDGAPPHLSPGTINDLHQIQRNRNLFPGTIEQIRRPGAQFDPDQLPVPESSSGSTGGN